LTLDCEHGTIHEGGEVKKLTQQGTREKASRIKKGSFKNSVLGTWLKAKEEAVEKDFK